MAGENEIGMKLGHQEGVGPGSCVRPLADTGPSSVSIGEYIGEM